MQEAANDAIAAGVGPIVLRLGIGVSQQDIAVVDDIPQAVDVDAAKEVAVVPVVHGIFITRQAVKGQQLVHIRIGEAEILVVPHIGNGVDFEIIQSGEDALFGDAQAAGQDSELQTVIRFQCVAEQAAQEGHHLIIVTSLEGLVQRDVILVDQDDDLAAVMFGKKHGEGFEAGRQGLVRHGKDAALTCSSLDQLFVERFFLGRQLIAVLQKAKPPRLVAHHRAQRRFGGLEGQAVHAFQAEEKDRELALVLLAQLLFMSDLQPVEEGTVAADLKEALQHAHVQGLAKAPGPGEEVHLSPVVQEFRDKPGFVDIIEITGAYLFKPVDADGKLLLHFVPAPFPPAGSCGFFLSSLYHEADRASSLAEKTGCGSAIGRCFSFLTPPITGVKSPLSPKGFLPTLPAYGDAGTGTLSPSAQSACKFVFFHNPNAGRGPEPRIFQKFHVFALFFCSDGFQGRSTRRTLFRHSSGVIRTGKWAAGGFCQAPSRGNMIPLRAKAVYACDPQGQAYTALLFLW